MMEEKATIDKTYYRDGQICSLTPCVNGKKHGLVKWWHENGGIWDEIYYVNGMLDGTHLCCWSDGRIFFKKTYTDAEMNGISVEFSYQKTNI